MFHFPTDINVFAVIVSAILYLILGAVWYSPKLFGTKWMELTGMKPEDCAGKSMWLCYLGGFIVAFITSYVLAYFVNVSAAVHWADGAKVGFLVWIGFYVTTLFSGVIWAHKRLALYFLDVFFYLIFLILAGIILAVWH